MTILAAEPGMPTVSDSVGVRYRRVSAGPEAGMIDRFLSEPPLRVPPGHRLTVFREPALESGFPDLVAVVWNPDAARAWPTTRRLLSAFDLRVMQHITRSRGSSRSSLFELFGKPAHHSVERLADSQMIRCQGNWLAPRALDSVFATKSIIAIEAKMTAWTSAIDQASSNRWFATESYILVPQVSQVSSILAGVEDRGVGLWVMSAGRPKRISQPARNQQPVSYASWLFNDWAWRDAVHKGEL